jgi:hypothetical protein
VARKALSFLGLKASSIYKINGWRILYCHTKMKLTTETGLKSQQLLMFLHQGLLMPLDCRKTTV